MKNSHRMGGKLDATWKGPYTVSEFVGKGRYRLMRGDGKELKKLYNGVLLKEYIPLGSALSVWKARLDAGHDRVRFLQPVVPPELR